MTPDEELFDEIISQALQILRLGANKRSLILRRLDKMSKEIVARLREQELAEVSNAQVKKVLRESEEIIRRHYTGFGDQLELPGIAETVALRTANSLQIALALDTIGLPRQSYFASVASNVLIEGNPASAWWRGQAEDTVRKFSGAVRTGLSNNETNGQIISRIVGKLGEPGVMDVSKRNAATLVQTSVQAVANDARLNTFEANDDVVTGIRQVSTLDSHTSVICVAYSGASWTLQDKKPIGKSPPWNGGCPRHFNCRSVEVPILKTFRELGLNIDEFQTKNRASDEGPINSKTSFDDFLKRKGKDYQEEMLGVGRADLWRSGKLTLRDLVGGDGRPLTLEELQRRFA